MINQCFENSTFIRFISNYYTCFHDILKTISSKCIKEMCDINICLTQKDKKQSIGYIPMAPIFANVHVYPNMHWFSYLKL